MSKHTIASLLIGAAALALAAIPASAKTLMVGPTNVTQPFIYKCGSTVTTIIDIGDESEHVTSAVYSTTPGGGEGGEFDKTPVLSTNVTLPDGACLDAHFSVLVGSGNFYGTSDMAMFQVTLTPLTGATGPVHMFGHYETPYGIKSPAVALGAEPDADEMGANFFQHVGTGKHDVPAGNYRVDVWWAGSPLGFPGATASNFILKLYTRR
ncbi:MAG TPA: hypothetical protein VG889_19085 [Rhizomicrobium sp.]|nr:hypothetical protein [Rhizomicrobium sp.]